MASYLLLRFLSLGLILLLIFLSVGLIVTFGTFFVAVFIWLFVVHSTPTTLASLCFQWRARDEILQANHEHKFFIITISYLPSLLR
jgi:hypothetical protein